MVSKNKFERGIKQEYRLLSPVQITLLVRSLPRKGLMTSFDHFSSYREEVRSKLQELLFVSPRDFIRQPRAFAKADLNYYIDELTDDCPEEDDLRFICHETDFDLAIFAKRLSWDSQFFGYEVARLNGIFPLGAYQARRDYNAAVIHL